MAINAARQRPVAIDALVTVANALLAGRERLFTVNVCRTSRFMSGLGGGSGVAAILEDEDAEHEPTEVRQRAMLEGGGN